MNNPQVTVRLLFKDRSVLFTGTIWESLQQISNAKLTPGFIADYIVFGPFERTK